MLRLKHLQKAFLTQSISRNSLQQLPKFSFISDDGREPTQQQYGFKKRPYFKKQPYRQGDRPNEEMQDGQSQSVQTVDADGVYREKFGKTKSEILDQWLEMDSNTLIKECQTLDLKSTDKHIENIQSLFEYLKRFEHEKGLGTDQGGRRGETLFQKKANRQTEQRHTQRRPEREEKGQQEYQHQAYEQKYSPAGQNIFGQQKLDFEKAKESLNEQLAKILNKRRQKTQEETVIQDKVNQQTKSKQQDQETAVPQVNTQFQAKLFKFDLGITKRSLQNRGLAIDAALPQFQFNNQESKFIDQIFEMNSEMLDTKFKEYIENQDNAILRQMNLNKEEFDKTTGINKKKILINLSGIKSVMNIDPNQLIKDLKDDFISYGSENFALLNAQSKDYLKKSIHKFINNDKNQVPLMKNPKKLQQLVELSEKLDLSYKDKLRHMIVYNYFNHFQSALQEINVEKAVSFGKVIQFLSSKSNDSQHQIETHQLNRIQNLYYSGIRKLFSKKNVQDLTFENQIDILKALPPVEGDAFQTSKSLHYLILQDILFNNPAERWESMDKDTVFTVVDRCLEMSKQRDLQSKLRACLLDIQTSTFGVKDYLRLFEKLTEDGKIGNIDVKVICNLMMRRNLKTSVYFKNSNEIKEHIGLYQYLYEKSPLSFAYLGLEIKYAMLRLIQLERSQYLSLQDMVNFSTFMIPSLFKPTMHFSEMILNNQKNLDIFSSESQSKKPENFKDHVKNEDLYQFVNQIVKRAEDGEFVFEHLQMAQSRIHRHFKPYHEKTFLLLQRIINDLLAEGSGLSKTEIQIMNRIFSNKDIAFNLFQSTEDLEKVLQPYLSSLEKDLQQQSAHQQKHLDDDDSKKLSLKQQEQLTDSWVNQIQAFKNLCSLTQDSQLLKSTFQSLVNDFIPILNSEILKNSGFSIDGILKINKQIIDLIEMMPRSQMPKGHILNKQFSDGLFILPNIKEIVHQIVEYHFMNKKPFVLGLDKFKRNIYMSKKIQVETNQTVINNNISSIINFMNHAGLDNGKDLAEQIIQQITNSRSIKGNDLYNLFIMIDKYGLQEKTQNLVVNVTSNLMTIGQSIPFALVQDTSAQDQQDTKKKQYIIKKYINLYKNEEGLKLLQKEETGLSPLSGLMADVIDHYADEEVLTCLQVLGNKKVDNYHQEFIRKIYERYSNIQLIESLATMNPKFFFKFAKQWPYFLRNNAILNQLISIKGSSALAKQQSEIISILTQQNVMHSDLLQTHFETFIKMKDKESVAQYTKEFLSNSAYLGFHDFDIQKLTTVIRRIYHSPEKVETQELLNYLTVLALSGKYYKEFDEKSVDFITQSIDLIEKKFTGIETMEVDRVDPITGETEKIKLNYYKSIPSQNKIYHKMQVVGKKPVLKFEKFQGQIEKEVSEEENEDQAQNEQQESQEPAAKALDDRINRELQQSLESSDLKQSTNVINTNSSLKDQEMEDMLTNLGIQVVRDDNDNEDQDTSERTIEDEELDKKMLKLQEIADKKDKRIYERKASESLYSEELEFHQYRKKKLQDMDKKSKHLLLFSNINQLNFVDINKEDSAKAWAVLFHFKNKSFDSIIYDDFESITMRNTIGKSKGHELFTKFYLKLVEKSYDAGFRLNLGNKCDTTGWPIDISLSVNQKKKVAFYFFLQEEVCLNTADQVEQPLGLQSLMLKHLGQISDYKVTYVTENDFFMNKDNIEDFVTNIMGMLGK